MPDVSVVLVNWNGMRWLPDCLDSLARQTFSDYEVILVDNGSTDGSAAWVAEHYPQTRLVCQDRNLGFGAANNIAIRSSTAKFVVTLNNDTRVMPHWLGELVAAVTGPDVGMVAARMLLWDRPDTLDSAGIYVDRAGVGWNRGWGQPAETTDLGRAVFGPCAGAALYRRTMLDEIGLFDEDFFAYYEDVDLAWRAQQAGWRCVYAPDAVVYHVHSATGKQGSRFKSYMLARNRIWTWCKDYPLPQLLLYAPVILLYDLMSLCAAVMGGQGRSAIEGRLAALSGLPRILDRRRHALRRVPSGALMRHLQPVESPLAMLRRHRSG